MYYLIEEKLKSIKKKQLKKSKRQYVALLSYNQWKREKESFDMGIDIEPDLSSIHSTKAEVNFDSLTGTFFIPDKENFSGEGEGFGFALDEKGIVIIDKNKCAETLINEIIKTKKWKFPSLERFLYDLIEQVIIFDRRLLEKYEKELDEIEEAVVKDGFENIPERLSEIRWEMRDLRTHYEQFLDLCQELEENENNFFKPENLRYFRLLFNRIERLKDSAMALSDYAVQIRDIYESHLEIKQNRIMTVLTIVTTIFMPLTLIVGWYGMNFKYMPELNSIWGYPIVIILSIAIVIGSLILFKKLKWL